MPQQRVFTIDELNAKTREERNSQLARQFAARRLKPRADADYLNLHYPAKPRGKHLGGGVYVNIDSGGN